MSLSPAEQAMLAQLTARKANEESKDPAIAAAESEAAKAARELEAARKRVEFLRVGPLGDISDRDTHSKASTLLKKLQIFEALLEGKNQANSASWWKDKKTTETHLVKAENVTEVQEIITEYYREYHMDFEIRSIGKSGIMEYLPRTK